VAVAGDMVSGVGDGNAVARFGQFTADHRAREARADQKDVAVFDDRSPSSSGAQRARVSPRARGLAMAPDAAPSPKWAQLFSFPSCSRQERKSVGQAKHRGKHE
jgi:hypothetical protein